MAEFEIGMPVEVHRGGDPSIPVAFDGERGTVTGHSTMMWQSAVVPTIGVRFDDRTVADVAWVVRWHVRPIPETWGEKLKRHARAKIRQVLEA